MVCFERSALTHFGIGDDVQSRQAGTRTIKARSGTLTARATVKVVAGARVSRIAYATRGKRLGVTVVVVDARADAFRTHPCAWLCGATVAGLPRVLVRTNARGVGAFTRTAKRGCYSVKVTRVTTRGFAWNRVTPKNGYCVI